MRIAVCDDERDQVHENMDLIHKWAERVKISVNVDTFSSAEEFLFRWSEGQPYDLAFFDIKMKKMTGMDLAKTIRKTDQDLQIIFITGIVDHVFEGYDVSALNYLIKPYAPKLLYASLDKAYALYRQKETGTVLISQEGSLVRIPCNEILYMEIRGHYFDIYTLTLGEFRTRKQMDDMLAILDKSLFIRCHRSYIVNIAHAAALGRQDVKLKTGQSVPISQPNIQPVTQLFLEYHYSNSV